MSPQNRLFMSPKTICYLGGLFLVSGLLNHTCRSGVLAEGIREGQVVEYLVLCEEKSNQFFHAR